MLTPSRVLDRFREKHSECSTPDTPNAALRNLSLPTIPSLHGIRAASALVVVFYHLGLNWAPGGYGVTAFFVLSGLLITHLLVLENEKTGNVAIGRFYARRSLRIFPAFYCFALVYTGGRILNHMRIEWWQVGTSLTYTRDYYQAIVHPLNNSMGHTWSLAVEEQFYLLWPLTFRKFRCRLDILTKLLTGVIVFVIVYRSVLSLVGVHPDYIYYAFDTRVDALGVGCLAAVIIHRGINVNFRSWIIGPIAVAGVAVLRIMTTVRFRGFDFNAVVVNAVLPVLFAIIIVHSIQFAAHPVYAVLNNPIARYLGAISYPLYLYHAIVGNIIGTHQTLFKVFGEVAICIGIASCSYLFVEMPFLKLKRRFVAGPETLLSHQPDGARRNETERIQIKPIASASSVSTA